MRFKKGNRWSKSGKGKLKYITWRKMVFEMNKRKLGLSKKYVCVKCNKKLWTTRALHAHHIYSWKINTTRATPTTMALKVKATLMTALLIKTMKNS